MRETSSSAGERGSAAVEGRQDASGPTKIALSWRRSQMCGVDPDRSLDTVGRREVDGESALAVAGSAVLRQMMAHVAGAPVFALVADRNGVIIDARAAAPTGSTVDLARDRIGLCSSEERLGTNSIGTALELKKSVRIRSDEHFLHELRDLDCLGAPIFSPVTGAVEGILALSAPASGLSPALMPFLTYAARDISDRLLARAPRAHLDLLQVYQSASRRHGTVVVFGDDVTIASSKASALLDSVDHALLRARAAEIGRTDPVVEEFALTSGSTVSITMRACGSSRHRGVLVELAPADEVTRNRIPRGRNVARSVDAVTAAEIESARSTRRSILVTGEAGTGRTHHVLQLAAGRACAVLDCGNADASWQITIGRAVASVASDPRRSDDGPLLVLENVEELTSAQAAQTSEALRHSEVSVAMTSASVPRASAGLAALAAMCDVHLHIPPLRARPADLPDLLESITLAVCADAGVRAPIHWTAEAKSAILAHDWPGNLHELRAVVERAVAHCANDTVVVADLPPSILGRQNRRLTPLEHSEREVIETMLRSCNGNKVHVAQQLGISRTTLYKRIRQLGLS